MNEIFVRTHNGLYRCGDTVYGVIYLKIGTPTAAFGVRLRITGFEKYDLYIPRSDEIEEDTIEKVHRKKWIDCDNVHVYKSQDGNPMAIDHYMFPFQMNLPLSLPASCWYESNNGSKAMVRYTVEAEVLGCKNIKASQTFHLKHSPLEKLNKHTSVSEKFTGGNVFRRVNITVTAKLLKPEYSTSENVPLLLRFADLVKTQRKVENITVEVFQVLKMNLKYKRPSSMMEDSDSTSQSAPPIGEEDCGTPQVLDIMEKCLLTRDLCITDNEILESGFTFLVPLSQAAEPVIPTTKGQYMQASHYMIITITIEGLQKQSLRLPFQCLYPRDNEEWTAWDPPEWSYRCKLIKSSHVCSVPESILASEAFAGFPGFQAF